MHPPCRPIYRHARSQTPFQFHFGTDSVTFWFPPTPHGTPLARPARMGQVCCHSRGLFSGRTYDAGHSPTHRARSRPPLHFTHSLPPAAAKHLRHTYAIETYHSLRSASRQSNCPPSRKARAPHSTP